MLREDDRSVKVVIGHLLRALRTGALTLGPNTLELEAGFATRHDSPFAVATNSGTSALEIILRALGVEGKEVVSGYSEVEAADLDEVLRMVKTWPGCPVVEIRPLEA